MKRRRRMPEQIVRRLREAERMLGEGRQIPEVTKELGQRGDVPSVAQQRRQMMANEVKRLRELERKNAPLKGESYRTARRTRALAGGLAF
jgi:putative transposase